MAEQQVLKGVYKDGPVVVSIVITDGKHGRIMVKGAEPVMAGDPAMAQILTKAAEGVREHVAKCETRDMVAVVEQRPTLIDQINLSPDVVEKMGVRWVGVMDRDSGLIVRRCGAEPVAVSLAYSSLKASPAGTAQPGRVELPNSYKRKPHKELTDDQKQVIGVAVQIAGETLLKLVVFDDEGTKLLGTVHDLPPARAHSSLYDLDALASELRSGTALQDIAKKMETLRGG